uniref:AlNc14C825G12544 protein n=1 Tax=Albugo laibachii Nc14 TaxID=890382 RepID=F0X239_9STRA|nr:AlNc14C825G12544 [Albugo laibachii Nc14]|eukprot:CCA27910.1 AlNc14C825G12544 [Albugo laibachii Nc14]
MSKLAFFIALIIQHVDRIACDTTPLPNEGGDQTAPTSTADGEWSNPQGLTRNIATGNRIQVAKSQIILSDQDKNVFLRSIADTIVDRMNQDGEEQDKPLLDTTNQSIHPVEVICHSMNSLKTLRSAYVDSISVTLSELEDLIPQTVAILRKDLSGEISVFTQYEAQFADLHITSKCLTDFEFDYHSILEKHQRLMLQIDQMWREFRCSFNVLAQFFINSSSAAEEKAIKIIDTNYGGQSGCFQLVNKSSSSVFVDELKVYSDAEAISGRTYVRIPVGLTLEAWKSHTDPQVYPSTVRIRMGQKFLNDLSARYSDIISKNEIFPLIGVWKVQADQAD